MHLHARSEQRCRGLTVSAQAVIVGSSARLCLMDIGDGLDLLNLGDRDTVVMAVTPPHVRWKVHSPLSPILTLSVSSTAKRFMTLLPQR